VFDGVHRLGRLAVVLAASVAVVAGMCGAALGLLQTLPSPVVDQARASRALALVESTRAARTLVWVGKASPLYVRCRAFGRRDVAQVGRSVRFVVVRGRVHQTSGHRLAKAWLLTLSIMAGCPHEVRFLLWQRLTAAFSHDRTRLLEPDRAGRARIYEIAISLRPSIELTVSRATMAPTGALLQRRGPAVRSTFLSGPAAPLGTESAQTRRD
jgi:hypothetical protein